MGECWAKCIGGCEGGISGEHIVSKGLFLSPVVTVQGFSWCKEEPKTVGINNLTKNILCRKHNSLLSPLDSAAISAFDMLRKQTELANERSHLPVTWPILPVKKFPIDALLLERWMLKTLLNFTCGGDLLIGVKGVDPGVPAMDLVEICYGLADFTGESGMYGAANIGMSIKFAEEVYFSPLIKEHRVLGGFFEFRGIRLLLVLMADGFKYSLSSIPDIPSAWADATLTKRLEKIVSKHGHRVSHIVEFNWTAVA